MIPVRTPECTGKYELPGGDESNDLPYRREMIELPDHKAVPVIISTWEADTDELAAIMVTGRVELALWGEPIQPCHIAPPGDVLRVKDPPIARDHLERAIKLLVVKLKDMGYEPAPVEDVLSGIDECLLETAGQQ